jgi:hypothetical protein
MTIYRGTGGGGNATTDTEVALLTQLEQSAVAAAAAAEAARAAALLAATEAAESASSIEGDVASAEAARIAAEAAQEASEEAQDAAVTAQGLAEDARDAALAAEAALENVYTKDEADDLLDLKANTSTVNTALALKANQATTYTKTEVDSSLATKQAADAELTTLSGMGANRATFLAAEQAFSMRNRIINGDMRIDQRNAGASFTPAASGAFFSVDRWSIETTRANSLTLQRVSDAPVGFTNSLRVTVASSVASLSAGDSINLFQSIEGFNTADLAFGTANAQPVSISFWVKSSVTGVYSWFIRSGGDTRCFVSTYTIAQANTWEFKTVTIAGDTTSFAYDTANGRGFMLGFALGDGSNFETTGNAWTGVGARMQVTGTVDFVSQSNGATFHITGVQLEAGSVATPFERRPYGTELALCQRYLPAFNSSGTGSSFGVGQGISTTGTVISCVFPVSTRVAPSGISISNISHISTRATTGGQITYTTNGGVGYTSTTSGEIVVTGGSGGGLAAGLCTLAYFSNASGQVLFTGCEL